MNYQIEIRKIKDFLNDKVYLTNINMQRKYIYNHAQATALLDSIQKKIPIPAIYLWSNHNGTYDVLDGKQRITVMRLYVDPNYLPDNVNNFFIDHMNQNDFENYEIPVIICNGTEQEKIETFKRINTTAIPLKEFEIYNALYQGLFVEEFGNWGINASPNEEKFFGGGIRGENCIKATKLFTSEIEKFFAHNRDNSFVNGLKTQIDRLVTTVIEIFSAYNDDWYVLAKIVLENSNDISKINSWKLNKQKICELFNEHKLNGDTAIAPSKESFYNELLGCYNIVGLDGRRFFAKDDKKVMYEKLASGISRGKKLCPHCDKEFSFDEFEIDHIRAWSKGGRTELNNAQLICKKCNASKGAR
ncbi:MAG: DUF262 domain-containing protein [Clostridiales bacterium]|jgi:hypothetical protein|nr:DUF262 domain-containing protein [Clostridiales bacterium]